MGAVFGIFAGFYYWVGFFFGTFYSKFWGRLHFWITFVGVNLTFFPMHFLGLAGMPRRISDYPDIYWSWNFIASVGSFLSFVGLLVFIFIIIHMFLGTFKIYNLGLTYMIHTSNTNKIVVRKVYVYNNNYFIRTNDLIFKKWINNTYLFFNLYNLFVKKLRLNFIFKVLNERK
jgi:heme/copper-type cytochrome/quinol oxidase subunit 1